MTYCGVFPAFHSRAAAAVAAEKEANVHQGAFQQVHSVLYLRLTAAASVPYVLSLLNVFCTSSILFHLPLMYCGVFFWLFAQGLAHCRCVFRDLAVRLVLRFHLIFLLRRVLHLRDLPLRVAVASADKAASLTTDFVMHHMYDGVIPVFRSELLLLLLHRRIRPRLRKRVNC